MVTRGFWKDLSNVSLWNMHGGLGVLYSAYITHVFNVTNLESFTKLIQLKFEPLRYYTDGQHASANIFQQISQNSYSGKLIIPAKHKCCTYTIFF